MTKKVLSLLLVTIIALSCVAVASNATWSHEAPTLLAATDVSATLYISPTTDNENVRYKFILVPKTLGDNTSKFTNEFLESIPAVDWEGTYDGSLGSNVTLTRAYDGEKMVTLAGGEIYYALSKAINTVNNAESFDVTKKTTVSIYLKAPDAPDSSKIYCCNGEETDTSITFFVGPAGIQYSYDGGTIWKDVNTSNTKIVVGGLESGKDYTFLFRYKAVANQWQGNNTLSVPAHTVVEPETAWETPGKPTPLMDKDNRVDRTEKQIFLKDDAFRGHAANSCEACAAAHTSDYVYYVNDKFAHCIYKNDVHNNPIIEIDGYYADANARANGVITPLQKNTPYSVSRAVALSQYHKESPKSEAVSIRTKDVPNPPPTPVVAQNGITDTTITMDYMKGDVEYSYDPTNEDSWISPALYGDGDRKVAIFKNLKPGTEYTIYARYKASDSNIASDVSQSINVRTKLEAAAAPKDIILVDKRMIDAEHAVIVVKEETDVVFRISEVTAGERVWSDWQSSGTFKVIRPIDKSKPTVNLLGGHTYTIQAMKKYDKEKQMESEKCTRNISIPNRTPYNPEFSKMKISYTNTAQTYGQNYIRGTDVVEFTAVGDIYSTKSDAVFIYGDERFCPVSYYTNVDGTKRTDISISNYVTGKFRITATTSLKKVTVVYERQKFDGEKWVPVINDHGEIERVEKSLGVSVKDNRTILTNITDFLTYIANFFLDKLPAYIIKMFSLFS